LTCFFLADKQNGIMATLLEQIVVARVAAVAGSSDV
jgi:hypothetical protein